MHRPSAPALLSVPLLAVALAAGLAALPRPAQAQVQRAYAPEELWTLSVPDQTRVISLEYREQSRGREIPNDQLRFYLDQVRLSRWTFSQVKNDIARSLGGSGGGWGPTPPPPPPPPPVGQDSIRCESRDGRMRVCDTPWRGPSRLTRQHSSAACVEGRSWFNGNGRVTVTGGCRADFGPAGGGWGGVGQTVTLQCESDKGRYTTCGQGVVGMPRLVRQLSRQRCTYGESFGVRGGQLWVDHGCRGVFEVRTGQWGGSGGSDYSVTCSSDRNRYNSCAWNSRYGRPYLIQQLSRAQCREGYSWGYDGRTQLWVNHGCSARFGAR
ncbi:DUF3011 domain-containing protein [Thermomonas flagellata]|uniref:DUF3011 domain-containing protein n=1 Tax=Thermomonas flagellata TaxID=2888524 RepID=UPI001F04E5BA|nr:DUF3011 domain-containing protein [Thermomonas flagellata]